MRYSSSTRSSTQRSFSRGLCRCVRARRWLVWASSLVFAVPLLAQQAEQPPVPSAPTETAPSVASDVGSAPPSTAESSSAADTTPRQPALPAEKVAAEKEAPATPQPWEFSAYKVQIWLVAAPTGELDAQFQASLATSLARQIEAWIGAPWDAVITAPPLELHSLLLANWDLVTPQLLDDLAPAAAKVDKIIVLKILPNPREFVLEAREYDCRLRIYGPTIRRAIRQLEQLDTACFDAATATFRAVTRIDEGAPKSSVVRLRAGGLIRDDRSPCYVGLDDVLQPIVRVNDRAGLPQLIGPIDWTYLLVNGRGAENPNLLNCRVWSSYANPIQGRVTSRKERYALKVRATGSHTLLKVESKPARMGDTPHPMTGLEVYAKVPTPDPPPTTAPPAEPAAETNAEAAAPSATNANTSPGPSAEPSTSSATAAIAQAVAPTPPVDKEPSELLGYTDWRGAADIPSNQGQLRILYVKNGGQLLARLPMVPGFLDVAVAQVPDDAPRLTAEGFVRGIQGQLMDLEAQRQILASRIRTRISEGNLDDAEKMLDQLRLLPTRNDLLRQVDLQIEQQPPSPNKTVQDKIVKLYASLREVLAKYLNPNLNNDLLRQLNQARAAPPPAATTASNQ